MPPRAYLDGFTYDVFISYGRLDDAETSRDDGWVTTLRELLMQELAKELGEPVSVFKDDTASRNGNLDDIIKAALHTSALFLAVVTPKFCKSQWCKDELNWFLGSARRVGSSPPRDGERLFKVIAHRVDNDATPAPLIGAVGYNFVRRDAKHDLYLQMPLRDLDDLENEATIEFGRLIRDLAHRLTSLRATPSAATVAPTGRFVFLAETVRSVSTHRERMGKELESQNCQAQDGSGAATEADVRLGAAQAFESCELSIHLIGAEYGRTPEDSPRSVVELQLRAALAAVQTRRFPVVVWLDSGLQITDPRQLELLKALQLEFVNSPSFKLLNGVGFEEVESFVRQILAPAEQSVLSVPTAQRMVFLQFSESDLSNASAIQEHLFKRGLSIRIPAFRGTPGELRRLHAGWLKECHATLIYYGEAPDRWVYQKRDEVRQVLRDKLPSKVSAGIFVGPPPDSLKGIIGKQDPDFEVIECPSGFCPDQLDRFIEKIHRVAV